MSEQCTHHAQISERLESLTVLWHDWAHRAEGDLEDGGYTVCPKWSCRQTVIVLAAPPDPERG